MPKVRKEPIGKLRRPEEWRAKIQTTKILDRLTKHIVGELKNDVTGELMEMSASQVTAAVALLRKVIPDLSVSDINATVQNHHYVVSGEPVSEAEWAQRYATPQQTEAPQVH